MHPLQNLRWGMAILPSPNTDGQLDIMDTHKSLMHVYYRVSTRLQQRSFKKTTKRMHFLFIVRKISVLYPFPK